MARKECSHNVKAKQIAGEEDTQTTGCGKNTVHLQGHSKTMLNETYTSNIEFPYSTLVLVQSSVHGFGTFANLSLRTLRASLAFFFIYCTHQLPLQSYGTAEINHSSLHIIKYNVYNRDAYTSYDLYKTIFF